ncbi:MAG: hypothetical protein ABJC79_10990 [Acidimicrobiia bacterium]
MSAFQLTAIIAVPLTILLVTIVLLAFARPDRDEDNGAYASYLALASVFSLYLGLLALAALGEAVTQYLVVGDSDARDLLNTPSTFRTYFSLMSTGGPSAIAGFATLTALMAVAFSYHARRRTELTASSGNHPTIDGINRAYRASVCFAMISLIAIGAVVAGSAGYDFFAERIGSTDELRDQAMGSLLAYGGLVLLAGVVFRRNIWDIRGGNEVADDGPPEPTEVEDVR